MTQHRARQAKKTSSEEHLKQAPLPPLPFKLLKKNEEKNPRELERMRHKEGVLTVQEAAKLIEDLEEKGDKFKQKLDEMFRQRGITPEYLQMYLNNPTNFNSQEWEYLQKQRQSLVESLHLPIGLRTAEGAKSTPADSHKAAKGPAEKAKERRSKAGAAQRRGWLPMR